MIPLRLTWRRTNIVVHQADENLLLTSPFFTELQQAVLDARGAQGGAVFAQHASTCSVVVYFSPALSEFAPDLLRRWGAYPCAEPPREQLRLVAGNSESADRVFTGATREGGRDVLPEFDEVESPPLGWLAAWFRSQCDGAWEHTAGITIETTDNPGWWVRISTTIPRPEEFFDESDPQTGTWLTVYWEDGVLHGACSPTELCKLLSRMVSILKV